MIEQAANIAANFLRSAEGFRANAYFDVNGFAIGYGNHYYQDGSPVRSGDEISGAAALDLLTYYAYQNAQTIADQLAVTVPVGMLAALTSLRYNCGTITIALLNLINSGADLDTIKTQFLRTCVTSDGVYSPALAARRVAEWDLVNSNSYVWILVAAGALAIISLTKD